MIAEAKKPTPDPLPDPDRFSPQDVRDFIMSTPMAQERLEQLNKYLDRRENVGEWWMKHSSNQQYSDFDDQANLEYFKKTYPFLIEFSGLIGFDEDKLPEGFDSLDDYLLSIPDEEWDAFIEDAKTLKRDYQCFDEDRASELEMEAANEWWEPPYGGYDDFLRELKLKFRNGRISHMLDSLDPWELLELASANGHYIERQGEGSVWMDTERAAQDVDLEDIEKVINDNAQWRRQRVPEEGEAPKPPKKDVAELHKEWDDRKREAWQGTVGHEFMDALKKLADAPDKQALLSRYSEQDLWQVFNWVIDDEAEERGGPFWWTWPQYTKKGYPEGQPDTVVPAAIHFTKFHEAPTGSMNWRRWEAEGWTKEAATEAAVEAWEKFIRSGRKPVADDPRQMRLKFEAIDPKDFIEQQPDPQKGHVGYRCPKCGFFNQMTHQDQRRLEGRVVWCVCHNTIPVDQFESIDPKDFIEQTPAPGPDDLNLWAVCPACQRRWSITMRAQRVYSGTNVVCPCGQRIPADQFESVDPKDFIAAQPEFSTVGDMLSAACPHCAAEGRKTVAVYKRTWKGPNEVSSLRCPTCSKGIPLELFGSWSRRVNEAVDPKDFIEKQPALSKINDRLQVTCPHCGVYNIRVRAWSDDANNSVISIPCYSCRQSIPFEQFRVLEAVDPKDFIMAQPEFGFRIQGQSPNPNPDPYEIDLNLDTLGWRGITVSEPSPEHASWEITFNRNAGQEIAKQRGEDIDARAMHDAFRQVVYHFKGWIGIDFYVEKENLDYDYRVVVTPLTGPKAAKMEEAVYRGGQDPDAFTPGDIRDWVLTGGPDVGTVLHDSPTLYVIIPGDQHTYDKYLPHRDRTWRDHTAGGDVIIVVPDPDEQVPLTKTSAGENLDPVSIREWFNAGLEANVNGPLDDVFKRSYGPELQKVLTKHYDTKARQAKREGDEDTYAKSVTCLAQVGGHKALRGHYRHLKPGTLPDFDWKYAMVLAQKGRLRAAARWLRVPKEMLTKEGMYAVFDDWQDMAAVFKADRHSDWSRVAKAVFDYNTSDMVDHLYHPDNKPKITDVTSHLSPANYASIRKLLTWARLQVPADVDEWLGVKVQPGGTVLITPQIVAQLPDREIEYLLDHHAEEDEAFDADGRLAEIAEKLQDAWQHAEAGATEDAIYTGYTDAVEASLGSPAKWIKVGTKDKLAFLIPWAQISTWLQQYSEDNDSPYDGGLEDLVTTYAEKVEPSEEYYPKEGAITTRFQQEYVDYQLDELKELDPPTPAQDPNQPELFEPEPSYAPVPVKSEYPAPKPPPAPGIGEAVDPRDFMLNLQPVRLRYVPGERVKTNMGIRQSGVIVKPFYWEQSTDGTYKPPTKRDVAVQWDNGSKGYIPKVFLSPELTQPGTTLGESLLVEGYKYACAMIELPPPQADFLLGWGKANIPDDVLWQPPDDESMGRELDIHITVKYGITLNEVPHELHQIAEQTPAFPVYMGKVTLFQQADHDVVKLDVESPWLRQLNARITKELPCEGDKHPQYHPHVTLAYVKKGACDQLVGQDPFAAEGTPGAEFVAYGLLFKGASDLEDDPARVKEHVLFNKEKKPEPPLDQMEVAEAVDPKDYIEQGPTTTGIRIKLAFSELDPTLTDIYIGEWGRMSVDPPKPFPITGNYDYLDEFKKWAVERYGANVVKVLRVEPVGESGPYENLPFPTQPSDLIRFLRGSRKRSKTLL